MALTHLRMLIHGLLKKDPDIAPEESPLIILDSKPDVCMSNNGKDTKHTMQIARRIKFSKEWCRYQNSYLVYCTCLNRLVTGASFISA